MYGARALVATHAQRPFSPRLRPDPFVSKYPAPNDSTKASTSESYPVEPASRYKVGLVALFTILVGLAAGVSIHLVNLRIQNLDIVGSLTGLSAAIDVLAICILALVAKRMTAR